MNYVVQAPGVPGFAGEQVFEVWTKQWPNAGDDLPVVFDPRQLETLKTQWVRLMSHADPEQIRLAMARAEPALGIDLNGDGKVGS